MEHSDILTLLSVSYLEVQSFDTLSLIVFMVKKSMSLFRVDNRETLTTRLFYMRNGERYVVSLRTVVFIYIFFILRQIFKTKKTAILSLGCEIIVLKDTL